jgi:hypothetical protein
MIILQVKRNWNDCPSGISDVIFTRLDVLLKIIFVVYNEIHTGYGSSKIPEWKKDAIQLYVWSKRETTDDSSG